MVERTCTSQRRPTLDESLYATAAKLVACGDKNNGSKGYEFPLRHTFQGGNVSVGGEITTDAEKNPIEGVIKVLVQFDGAGQMPNGCKKEVFAATFGNNRSALYVEGKKVVDPPEIDSYTQHLRVLTDELTPHA